MEAAEDEARAGGICQGQGEALVPAGILERVEPDEAEPLDRSTVGGFEDSRAGRQLVELARDREDLVEMGVEDGVEAPPVDAAGQPVQASPKVARLAGEEQDEDQEDEDGDR